MYPCVWVSKTHDWFIQYLIWPFLEPHISNWCDFEDFFLFCYLLVQLVLVLFFISFASFPSKTKETSVYQLQYKISCLYYFTFYISLLLNFLFLIRILFYAVIAGKQQHMNHWCFFQFNILRRLMHTLKKKHYELNQLNY